jgi:serine/threonine-protein kinase HipA
MADELVVWLNDERVAVVQRERGRLRLSYTSEAMQRYELGLPLLSLSLPLTTESYPQGLTRAFLDGLLPEGESRRVLARDLGLQEADTFGLIQALGRDCAGALVIQPAADAAPGLPTTLTAEPLSDDDIADLVANLRSAPLGAGGRVRISLAGVQEKLLLTRMPDGRWGRPVDGTPSTHILKPEIAGYPATIENEAFCMRLAHALGMEVAPVETTQISNRKLIVVERYDRVVGPGGGVKRLHQEDLCQATGLPPQQKYEADGGPSLRRMAGLIEAATSRDSLERLLQAVTLDVVIGNGDAHAKNFSILHTESGALRLAPLYDLMSTLHYGDDYLAMHIDGVQRTNHVTAHRLINEATRWGLARGRATAIVRDVLDRIPNGVERARRETPGVPDGILSIIEQQLERLQGDI